MSRFAIYILVVLVLLGVQGGVSLAERSFMVSSVPRDGWVPRLRAMGEGRLLPLLVVRPSHDVGVARRQLNSLCLIGCEIA